MTLQTTNISLKAIAWTQEIRRYPTIDVEGLRLRVTCKVHSASSLSLIGGRKLSDFEIDISIFQEWSPAKHREKLSEKAIGDLWSVHDDNFIHGSLYLKASDYQAVWEQVHDGNYVDCQIVLGVGPVQYDNGEVIWRDNPLSIESAAVSFERKPIPDQPVKQEPMRKRSFLSPNRGGAVILFAMAAVASDSRWIRLIFDSHKDVTTGESMIIAAILFVGGLFLWFGGIRG